MNKRYAIVGCGGVGGYYGGALAHAGKDVHFLLPSMKLDFDNGRPMEIDAIYVKPIAAAREAGVEMPRTSELCRQLKAMDRLRGISSRSFNGDV